MKHFLPKSIKNPSGFTLIELMVVISIIAFLAVIGIASFTNAQKQARNSRRQADVESIATALESNFNSISGKYPAVNCTSTTVFANGKCPTPPTAGSSYIGIPAAETTTYEVCADLEGTGSTSDASEKEFCRKNQQ